MTQKQLRCSKISTGLALPWDHNWSAGGTGFASALFVRELQVSYRPAGTSPAEAEEAVFLVRNSRIISHVRLAMHLQISNNTFRIVLLALLLMPCVSLSAAKRPNVVMLLADDLGWKDIGCYGGPVKTPTLDRLAADGVRFTDFYSGAAVCSPSRATLLTGRQHLRAGIYSWIHDSSQESHLLEREVTLAEVLKSNGYETVHLGKWHLGMPTPQKPNKPTPADHGFDYWFATANNAQPSHKDPVNFIRNGTPVGKTDGYACQVVVDEAISWLDETRDRNKPFFLNVWFHEPHAPIAAPDEIVSRYGKLNDPAAIYSGTIDNTDRAIARLLEKLKPVDSPANTLIIYSSDNGSYRADRVGHLRGVKGSNYDGGIRVPGIFYWPGTITRGQVEHEPAGLVDLLPTVCGLLGINTPNDVHLDGSDLSPLLTGRKDAFVRHQPLFWLLPASGPAVAIRDGQYSLVAQRAYDFPRDTATMAALRQQIEETLRKNGTLEDEIRGSTLDKQMFEGFKDKEAEQLRGKFILLNMFNESWIPAIKAGTYGRYELFDMAQDSGQKQDVSKQHPDIVAKLKEQMQEINQSVMADAPDWGSAEKARSPSNGDEGAGYEQNLGTTFLSRSSKPLTPGPSPRNGARGARMGEKTICVDTTLAFDGKLYVIGGQFHHDSMQLDQARVDIYDPQTDSWNRGPQLPAGHSHSEGGTFVSGGRIYMVGGHTTPDGGRKQIASDILALTPGGQWELVGKLPMPLSSPSAAIIHGKLFVAGGSRDGRSVEAKMWVRSAP